MDKRLEWLDLFRGIAALTVAAYHLGDMLGLPQLRFGFLAVNLFFVLSGIVLGRKYDAAIRAGMPAWEFAWHRLRRLYPMVVLTVLLLVAMRLGGTRDPEYGHVTGAAIVSVLLLIPYSSPAAGLGLAFPGDPAAWSLWAEFMANAIWFACLRAGRRATWAVFSLAALAFLVLAFHHRDFNIGPRSTWVEHVEGIANALTWFGVGLLIALRHARPIAPNALLLAVFAACCAWCQWSSIDPAITNLAVVVAGLELMIGLANAAPPGTLLPRLCGWLGMLSYPLYMIHLPAKRLAQEIASRGVDERWACVATIALACLAATLLNEWIVRRLPVTLGQGLAGAGAVAGTVPRPPRA